MTETTFEVRVPTELLNYGLGQGEVQNKVTEWLAISLFTDGQISSGQAAKVLSLSRVQFLDLLRTRGVAYINFSPDEIADELAAVSSLNVKLSE
jgi:predicted HTH domain antitoxin